MTRTYGARSVAAAIVLTASAACTSNQDPSGDPVLPTASATTAKPASSAASSEALALIRRYYGVRDDLRHNPTAPLSQLEDVAIGVELDTQKRLFERERQQGRHQTGDTKLAKLEVQSVSLDDSDPKAGHVPTVRVDVCYDVSKVDVVDKNDRSVVSPSRPDTGWIRYSVSNYDYRQDPSGSWRVASSHDLERAPCEAG